MENSIENLTPKTPPVKKGYIRLYRGETAEPDQKPLPDWLKTDPEMIARPDGSFFTDSLEEAKYYNSEFGVNDGNITYLDVPESEFETYRASNNRGKEFSARGLAEKEFFVPAELSKTKHKYIE